MHLVKKTTLGMNRSQCDKELAVPVENIEPGKTVTFTEEIRKENVVIEFIASNDSPTNVKVKALKKAITPKNVEFLDNSNLTNDICDNSEISKSVKMETFRSNIIYSKVSHPGKEKYIGLKITNLSDLKKSIPRLKLPTILTSTPAKKHSPVPEVIKQKLDKYCRTCAGLKVPLVDIFSEKGVQMRLNQQIQHLEDIDQLNSLSTQMCMDCICDLKMSYKFFMQIKKAEMKLKSVYNSLNETISKSASTQDSNENKNENEDVRISLSPVDGSMDEKVSDNKIGNIDDNKSDSVDYDYDGANDSYSYENESIEEFDPQETSEETTIKNKDLETSESETTEESKKTAYKYDESLNAYIKFKSEKDKSVEDNQTDQTDTENKIKVEKIKDTESMTIKLETSKCVSQPPKVPNILKRKLSSGNMSDESTDSSKANISKVNIDLKDLKDLKIPKLNLQDSTIKKEEDGIMYVTAKGSKPNEMLLIKVKKMDKPEKKAEKSVAKKKESTVHRIFPKYDGNTSKGSIIDEQIEEYKKKRVEILGESAIISESEVNVEETEIRAAGGLEVTDTIDNKNRETDLNKDVKEECSASPNSGTLVPERSANFEKLKQHWKDIKKTHDALTKDLSEDCSARLRTLLKQKDEYIADFVNYLKQRRIVVSRLKDDDIITLYETKNNVTLERPPVTIKEEVVKEVDPFIFVKTYDCDFCTKSFMDRDEMFEHAKYHDFRIMHYCEDCKQEFFTHKAKRAHNPDCLQKLLCKYCDVMLESKGKKRQHEQKHCDDEHGQLCDICGEKFKHQGTLDQHVKLRHLQLEKIFKCPQCPKKFALRTKLTFHLKSVHTTSRPYLCEDCGSDFKNPASLRHHRIRKHQPTNSKKECTVCQKLIPVYSMSKHMHTHKSYSIKCPHCDKMFKNTSTLKQHLRIHEDQRQYKCDMCGVGFNRRDGLRLHLKVHEKSDSRGLKECSCQVCGEKFPNHSTLVIHRNRTHKDGRNYTCHICNRSMISTRSLEWHLANIHNEQMPGLIKDESSIDAETKRVSCFHCDKTFKTEMILRTHVKNTHTQKEPIKCLDCDLMFTSDVRLKHHMMIEHNRLEGTLSCPHCTKRFVNQLRLKTHMISHSNERPHSCDLCGFMLKTKIQLIKHKQNRHSNERPLQCRYCSWRCKQVSALVCHERTHTNERPYSCSVCKQRFKYLGDKNKHERRHESLGGTGFKRIVTGRNTSKSIKRREEGNSTEMDSEIERETHEGGEGEEQMETDEVETFDETKIVKFETGEMLAQSGEEFQQIYVTEAEPDGNETTEVLVGVEETAVYTEEVTAGYAKQEVIAGIIDEQMLQPGTVVHLEQEDENGKIQVIPVMLSLPDLTDATGEVSLATASIMYST